MTWDEKWHSVLRDEWGVDPIKHNKLDDAIHKIAWTTATPEYRVRQITEDLLSADDYRWRSYTLNLPIPPVTLDEPYQHVEMAEDMCMNYKLKDRIEEEIMDYTNCYKGEKKMLIPDGDWAYPERMSNYYFRMPLQVHIDGRMYPNDPAQFRPNFKKIIFNDPATIILWNDGTKTVVKCGPDDVYDPEKGYVMCLLKRFCGNDTAMFHKFLKYGMKNYEEVVK